MSQNSYAQSFVQKYNLNVCVRSTLEINSQIRSEDSDIGSAEDTIPSRHAADSRVTKST